VRVGATIIGVVFAWGSIATPVMAAPWGAGSVASGEPLPFGHFADAKKKKKKKPKPAVEEEPAGPLLTPEGAEPKRQAIRDSVQGARDAGDYGRVAEGLETNGAELGDPIILLEAGETRLDIAQKSRDAEAAQKGIDDTKAALDILYLFADVEAGKASTDWIVISPADSTALISRGEEQLDHGEELLSSIEAEKAAAAQANAGKGGDKKKKQRKKRERGDAKPGTGMIAAGSAFIVVGVAGVSMVIAGAVWSKRQQKEVEKHMVTDPQIDAIDAAGNKANNIAYSGAALAGLGVVVGLPLLIVGLKKRKAAGNAPSTTAERMRRSLVVSPMFGGGTNGVALRGRF
jgi:hypothetical protein